MTDEPKLVIVKWIDSCGPSRWKFTEDFEPEIAFVQSVGWLLSSDKDCLVVAPHTTKDGQCCGNMTIPAVAVKSIKTLQIGRRIKQ